MNVLHYSLGFPPFRSGGMTKYCLDLMTYQINSGHNVALLWPGTFKGESYSLKIKKRKAYYTSGCDKTISSFELCNALPIPLLDGIKDVDLFTQKRDTCKIVSWLRNHSIDAFHIHTLMGLPTEVIDVAKECGIKIVFTTHDYFGLCSKCSFMKGNYSCINARSCQDCPECNKTALSALKMKLFQMKFYRIIKQTKIVDKLRKQHIKKINANYCIEEKQKHRSSNNANQQEVEKYKYLRQYYVSLLEKIDVIHYNSQNTRKVYEKYINSSKNGIVISISNSSIRDNKMIKKFDKKVRFSYLGPLSVRKGFFELINCTDKLFKDELPFELNIYSGTQFDKDYIVNHTSYSYNELPIVMENTDVLVAPSKWNETFGFTVLEALSYGVPVIISDMVGAKDLVQENQSGYIFHNSTQLLKIMKSIIQDNYSLSVMNKFIFENVKIKDMFSHSLEIESLYHGGIKR